MKEIKIADKKNYLEGHAPFDNPPKLFEKRECLHCGKIITVGDYKVFEHEIVGEIICCPNAPECDGTIIDWIPLRDC
jgi:hypothetical protein